MTLMRTFAEDLHAERFARLHRAICRALAEAARERNEFTPTGIWFRPPGT